MKTTSLNYDGWHLAQVLECYPPKLAPGEIIRWRIVCCYNPADDATGFTLVLYPTDGKEVITPPSCITEIKSTLLPLNMAALYCARAFTPQGELTAQNFLRDEVHNWTGRKLADATLADLLRLVRDEINVDRYGKPLGNRRTEFDAAALEQFAGAIAKASGTPSEKLRLIILKSWQPKFCICRVRP
jgi:hypothetical protein